MSLLIEWPYGPPALFLAGLAVGVLLADRGARVERLSWPSDAETWGLLVALNGILALAAARLYAGLSWEWWAPILGLLAGVPLYRLATRGTVPSPREITVERRR